MSIKCKYCRNKNHQCKECDKDWKDKFIPNDEVFHYFNYNYCGTKGINGYTYDWDSTNSNLKSTHWVDISGIKVCPYCGEKVLPIQDRNLDIIGHCCICEGARAELEYESKKEDMRNRHSIELQELQNEYKEKLKFDSDKLLKIKQEKERYYFEFFDKTYNHFNTKREIKFD